METNNEFREIDLERIFFESLTMKIINKIIYCIRVNNSNDNNQCFFCAKRFRLISAGFKNDRIFWLEIRYIRENAVLSYQAIECDRPASSRKGFVLPLQQVHRQLAIQSSIGD